MLTEPQSVQEFKSLVLQAIDFDAVPDRLGLLAALDEVSTAIELVRTGEQLVLTPSQRMLGQIFLDATMEFLGSTAKNVGVQ